ncbi:hypothetical protein [Campylobacter rectus]|uniref:hypothetical protein n=1 Tax=Campylobacter rectus TaxID=203 RepID=UPI000F5D8E9A|nr:hypothetical protein [Campylobacter rectus]RRD55365.1 hypothetical protein EII16_01295 [Campylobacter rectus]
MLDSREFQVLAGEVKSVRWNAATDECAFEIAGAKFNAKIAKDCLVPRENDRLAIAYDEQNEVWNFKNLTSGKWLKNYAWRAHFILSWAAIFDIVPGKILGAIFSIPIFYLGKYLSEFAGMTALFAFVVCLFLSLPFLHIYWSENKSLSGTVQAYLALRRALKEANL